MTITITLDTGNAAFDTDDESPQAQDWARTEEVSRILKGIDWARLVANGGDSVILRDYNGNAVGMAVCVFDTSEAF